jgi:hypothetical protein
MIVVVADRAPVPVSVARDIGRTGQHEVNALQGEAPFRLRRYHTSSGFGPNEYLTALWVGP